MSFDEGLAARVMRVLAREPGITSRRMFGGIAWLCCGYMACGLVGDDLVLRLGAEGAADALRHRGVRPMDFTGKPLRSMVYVAPEVVRSEAAMRRWVMRAIAFARALPPKDPRPGPRQKQARR